VLCLVDDKDQFAASDAATCISAIVDRSQTLSNDSSHSVKKFVDENMDGKVSLIESAMLMSIIELNLQVK
jgi:hypothetical protein